MREGHRGTHVVNADGPRRTPYFKPRSKIGISWDRLLYSVRYASRHWKDRIVVKSAAVILVYTVGFVFLTGKLLQCGASFFTFFELFYLYLFFHVVFLKYKMKDFKISAFLKYILL